MKITDLYRSLRDDSRLQKNWEQNQPRIDRAFEGPLIARTPREVATAALLSIKMRYLADGDGFFEASADAELISFARTQGAGGARLANVIEGKTFSDQFARTAALHAITFYYDRSAPNPLVRALWPNPALEALSQADPAGLINRALRPTWAERKARAVIAIADLLCTMDIDNTSDERLRETLRSLPGLGPERADAVGVFAFHRPWPILDNYLWKLLARHGVLDEHEAGIKSYDGRRKMFGPLWKALVEEMPENLNEIAATLYLWADEAERFGFTYS